ncbi:MAG: hypothetical protein A2X82_09080 [Geobacteraceae bacterium GWC2_55_20]|nr:MAG: hypothetical protein A2X82_09080 [Geobacteraceae bacterium GWC2_55_20]
MLQSIKKIIISFLLQTSGSVDDYVSTRPAKEQAFFYADNPGGLFKSAKKQGQLYALIRFFIVRIGIYWLVRIAAFVSAIWLLLYVGFSTIGR